MSSKNVEIIMNYLVLRMEDIAAQELKKARANIICKIIEEAQSLASPGYEKKVTEPSLYGAKGYGKIHVEFIEEGTRFPRASIKISVNSNGGIDIEGWKSSDGTMPPK